MRHPGEVLSASAYAQPFCPISASKGLARGSSDPAVSGNCFERRHDLYRSLGGEEAYGTRPDASVCQAIDQERWVDAALEMFGRVFGGATAYPTAKGIWRDDERNGALVRDEPVVLHCYTTPADIQDAQSLAALGSFCRTLGRDARQGGVGL